MFPLLLPARPLPQVPTNPPNPTSNVLLAEFTRDASSSVGADPRLFVKPVNTGDRNTP